MKRLLLTAVLLALALPPGAWAKGVFHPEEEFAQHEWVPIHLGPLNLSITKTVAYLLLGMVVTIVGGLFFMRGRTLTRRGTTGELIYDIAQTQVAEQGLPSKAIGRWFPYVATLMLFIFVVNLLGFIPLPLSDDKWHGIPTLGIYAATSSLSVTLALALMTWIFTFVEGIRYNGPVRYFKSWIPEVPKAMLPLIVPLEILGSVHAADLALGPTLREHARGAHADPDLHRSDLRARERRRRRDRRAGRDRLLPLRGRDRGGNSGVHLRCPVRHLHRLGDRARTLGGKRVGLSDCCRRRRVDAGKAIALALGIGLGALGAGVGIGNIFGSMIQAVARQPELRGELQGIQWLGFALTEAVVFYGLIGGLLAYVLI